MKKNDGFPQHVLAHAEDRDRVPVKSTIPFRPLTEEDVEERFIRSMLSPEERKERMRALREKLARFYQADAENMLKTENITLTLKGLLNEFPDSCSVQECRCVGALADRLRRIVENLSDGDRKL